ncbi:MAG: hypothetical protein ABI831_13860, partial [Betaproteobacteria bacterium]
MPDSSGLPASPDPTAALRGFSSPLLRPGATCWRIDRASRLAFLVDGEEYFGAVRSAIAKARVSFYILGWDIDSKMRLAPQGASDGLPEALGDFLNEVVSSSPDLHGYVLTWDYAMLYALEREWLPVYQLDFKTHKRLAFRLDDRHPVGASHHQKVIVVDDSVAFVSGFDLARSRWDTTRHAPDDPLRVNNGGSAYGPFHDVGAVVSGATARALGELCRDRWARATGGNGKRTGLDLLPDSTKHVLSNEAGEKEARLDPHRRGDRLDPSAADPWPDGIEPVLTDVDVAISRTEPAFSQRLSQGYPLYCH